MCRELFSTICDGVFNFSGSLFIYLQRHELLTQGKRNRYPTDVVKFMELARANKHQPGFPTALLLGCLSLSVKPHPAETEWDDWKLMLLAPGVMWRTAVFKQNLEL